MLPLPTTFLGFTRYTLLEGDKVLVNAPEAVEQTGDNSVARSRVDWSRVEQVRNSLWLRPDGFTAALVSHLSGNALRGRNGSLARAERNGTGSRLSCLKQGF